MKEGPCLLPHTHTLFQVNVLQHLGHLHFSKKISSVVIVLDTVLVVYREIKFAQNYFLDTMLFTADDSNSSVLRSHAHDMS